MMIRIKAAFLGGLLSLAMHVSPGAAQIAPPAWERPAPAARRAELAALLHVSLAGKRLVAVGERGLVLVSDDDGNRWAQSSVPVSVTLTKAFFVSEQTGWTIGHSGVVLRTDDGGQSWMRQLDGLQAARLAADKYTEENADAGLRGQAVAARQLLQDGADKPFFDALFTDTQNGFIIGAFGLIFRTEDGGKRWIPWMEHLANPGGLHLYGIARSGSSLFITGEQGLLLRSTDGGRKFNLVPTPYKGSYFGILPLANGGLYLYGLRGNLYRSADEGNSWTRIAVPSEASLSAGLALSNTEALFTNQAGQVFVAGERADALRPVPDIAPAPYTSVVRTSSGSWQFASLHGLARIEPGRVGAIATAAIKAPK